MNFSQGFTVITSLLLGFAFGWICKPDENESISAKSRAFVPVSFAHGKGAEPQHQSPVLATNETLNPNRVLKSKDTIKIPLGLIDSTMATLLSDGNLEGLGVALMTYNLPPERVKILLTGVKDVFAKMQAMEAAHSKLITTPNGDQYFVVEAFADEGAALSKKLNSVITEGFEGIQDDRQAVFQRQLASSKIFSDFGLTAKEISIDESTDTDGTPRYALTIRPSSPKSAVAQILGTSSVALDPLYLRNRYGNLIEKHVKPQ